MKFTNSTPVGHSSVCLVFITALTAASGVHAISGSETLTISADTSVSTFYVEDPSTPDFVSEATLNFQYSGTPITLHANNLSTYVDNNLGDSQHPHQGPTINNYTTLGFGTNLTRYTSKRSESNLLNINVSPSLLGSSTGVRFTVDAINGVATSGLSSTDIIDQVIVNGKEFASYDNDGSDGRLGIVSATTSNTLAGTSNIDNVFLTTNEAIFAPMAINSLALEQSVTATLNDTLMIDTGRVMFSDNSVINGNVNAGPNATVYVTGAGNQLNGVIQTNNLTFDGGDGAVAELTVSAQQTASSVNLAEVNLNLTADNVFQGADVHLMSITGWTGFDGGPEQGSLNIGSTTQNVNNLIASDYGALRLYGDGTIHAQERIAFASSGGTEPVDANLFSENEMNIGYGTFNGELRAQNLTIWGGDVYGDISDGTVATNATFTATTLHGAKSYSGSTTVGKGYWTNHFPTYTEFGTSSINGSTLVLENDAALTNSSSMNIWTSAVVVQDDSSGVVNRLNDNMSVTFQDIGRLGLNGQNYSGDAYERVGEVSTVQGYGKLEAFSGANGTATLSVGNIETGNNLLMVETDAGGHVLADSVNNNASDRLLKSVFVKAGTYERELNNGTIGDTATLDLPGFAEYTSGEIIAAQVDNININSATATDLVHIDSSADGTLTADRSMRGMILGGANGSVSNISGIGDLTVGEGGFIFWQDGSASISNDVEITNGGILRTFHEGQYVHFTGVMSGGLDVAGPGSINLANSNNDFSALTLRGSRLTGFNSSLNDIDIQITEGSALLDATLGSAGAFTGTLDIDGIADITIADGFFGVLNNTGSAAIIADDVSGQINNSSGTTLVRANNIAGINATASNGTVQFDAKSATGLLVDGVTTELQTSGEGDIVVVDAIAVANGSTLNIRNGGRQINFNDVLENNGTISIVENGNVAPNQDDGIHWTLDNRGSVSVKGKVSGSITNTASGSINMNGINEGIIDNTAGGQLNITYLENNSQVQSDNISTTGDVINNATGTIQVAGTYTQNGGSLLTNGQVTTDSMIINNGSVAIRSNSEEADGSLHVTNDLVQNGGSLDIGGDLFANVVEINGGTAVLTGSGTIHANTINGGLIGPGNSPGSLSIDGNYTQSADGTLLIEVGGLLAGTQFDVLDITGDAYLDGILDVDLYDLGSGLFSPSINDSFDILTAGSIYGSFDLLMLDVLGEGLAWELSYLTDEIGSTDVLRLNVVGASVVPVPAAVWLFGSGLIGLIGVARRKRA